MGLTIQEVITTLTSQVGTIDNTVDTLKFGSGNKEVSSVAVTFMPTYSAIKKANELGANLLITHEGLFYSHWDQYELGENEVYKEKNELITHSGLAIFRFHDYIHRYKPDGIMQGLIHSLKWDSYVEEHQPAATIVNIPEMSLAEVAQYIKIKLGINFIRFVGDPKMSCKRIGLLAGFRGGGSNAIPLCEKHNLDLVVYGEGPEWETPEYIRDANMQGREKGLIILGHAESEEPGMKYLAKQMEDLFPNTPIHFIPNEPIFKVL